MRNYGNTIFHSEYIMNLIVLHFLARSVFRFKYLHIIHVSDDINKTNIGTHRPISIEDILDRFLQIDISLFDETQSYI